MKGDISPLTEQRARKQARTLAGDLLVLRAGARRWADEVIGFAPQDPRVPAPLLRTWIMAAVGPILAGAFIGLYVSAIILIGIGQGH